MKKLLILFFVAFSVITLHANENKDTLIFKNRIRTLKEKQDIWSNAPLPIFDDTIFIKAGKLCFKEYYYTPDSGLQKIDRQVDIQQIKKIKKFIENKQTGFHKKWLDYLSAFIFGSILTNFNSNSMFLNIAASSALAGDIVSYFIEGRENSVTEIELYSGQTLKIYTGTQSRKTIKQLKKIITKK